MIRVSGLMVLLVALDARAEPVCARPEVLRVVAELVARAGSDARVIAGPVGQAPLTIDVVRCAVPLRETYYDTTRTGLVPQTRESVYRFDVRQGAHGLFVMPE